MSACEDQYPSVERMTEPEFQASGNDVNARMGNTGVSSSAHVMFGDPDSGSHFPPPERYDESIHAKDKMVPRTVVIAKGGEVTYDVHELHQVAIYEPGTQPEDIDLSDPEDLVIGGAVIEHDFIINDPDDRIALSPPHSLGHTTWSTPEDVFDEPGKYLVICTPFPHFVISDMYGWVIVK